MGTYEQEFGKRLRKARQDAGLTKIELSEEMFVSPLTVKSWELGHRQPSLYNVCELAKILHVSVGYLVAGEE